MPTRLRGAERAQELASLSGWELTSGRDAISRQFIFADFNEAFGWMTRAALIAEKMDHHPEWTNIYRTVTVTLSTHDAGGLTMRDIRLARALDRLAREAGAA
jgi:4a-hydroxytetrahydrobiopterin dehydratase